MQLLVVTDINTQPPASACLSKGLVAPDRLTRLALNEIAGRADLTGERLHRFLFHDGGMDRAVCDLRPYMVRGVVGIGYSAGGTALWRAAACGAWLDALFCISSTRLRGESAISPPSHVIFGAEDPARPSDDWLSTVPRQARVFAGAGHGYYLDPEGDAATATRACIAGYIRDRLTGAGGDRSG